VKTELDLRQQAVSQHIQVQNLLPIRENPYGEGHSMEVQAPVLDQSALQGNPSTPSTPPAPLDDQAFQTQLLREVEKPKLSQEGCPGDQDSISGTGQSETRSRLTHAAQLATDHLPFFEYFAGLEKVDFQARRPTPTDEELQALGSTVTKN